MSRKASSINGLELESHDCALHVILYKASESKTKHEDGCNGFRAYLRGKRINPQRRMRAVLLHHNVKVDQARRNGYEGATFAKKEPSAE
jgi:hypothetical protein